jgi:hypothetical protein
MYAGSSKDNCVWVGVGPYMLTSTTIRVTSTGHTGGLQQICKLGFVSEVCCFCGCRED